jgi:hypothetical protein
VAGTRVSRFDAKWFHAAPDVCILQERTEATTTMPGYKSLPQQFNGPAAEQVRIAEALQRLGANEDAAHLLEAALEVCAAASPELPGWLCGRLASVYRTLKRHDDEVRLLVRYRDSQRSEDARSRFDARLSKARAIAERQARTETRMLASVRTAVTRRPADASASLDASDDDVGYPPGTIGALRESFVAAATTGDQLGFTATILRVRRETKEGGLPPERMVAALKRAWRGASCPPNLSAEAWSALYSEALTRSLALYFDEEPAS